MIFVVPLVAFGLGFILIALIKSGSPAVHYERMGHEEKLDPDEQAMTMGEEEFRIFIVDFYHEKGFTPVKLYEESEGVFVMLMENKQPLFGGKSLVRCVRSLECDMVSSKEVWRFREMVRGEPGSRGVMISSLPFTLEAQEVGRELGIELVGPNALRRLVNTGGTTPIALEDRLPE